MDATLHSWGDDWRHARADDLSWQHTAPRTAARSGGRREQAAASARQSARMSRGCFAPAARGGGYAGPCSDETDTAPTATQRRGLGRAVPPSDASRRARDDSGSLLASCRSRADCALGGSSEAESERTDAEGDVIDAVDAFLERLPLGTDAAAAVLEEAIGRRLYQSELRGRQMHTKALECVTAAEEMRRLLQQKDAEIRALRRSAGCESTPRDSGGENGVDLTSATTRSGSPTLSRCSFPPHAAASVAPSLTATYYSGTALEAPAADFQPDEVQRLRVEVQALRSEVLEARAAGAAAPRDSAPLEGDAPQQGGARREEVQRMDEHLSDAHAHAAVAQRRAEGAVADQARLRRALMDAELELQHLSSGAAQAGRAAEAAAADARAAREELSQAWAAADRLQADADGLRGRVAELERNAVEQREALAARGADVAALTSQLDGERAMRSRCDEELGQVRARASQMAAEVVSLRSEAARLALALQARDSDLQALQAQVLAADAARSQLEQAAHDAREERAALQQRLAAEHELAVCELEQRREAEEQQLREAHAAAQAELKASREDVASMSERCEASAAAASELQGTVSGLATEAADLRSALEAANARVAKLEAGASAAVEAESTRRGVELEAEESGAQTRQQLEEALEQRCLELDAVHRELRQSQADAAARHDAVCAQLEHVSQRATDLGTNLADAMNELVEKERQHDAAIGALRAQLSAAKADAVVAREQLAAALDELALSRRASTDADASWRARLREGASERDALEAELATAQDALRRADAYQGEQRGGTGGGEQRVWGSTPGAEGGAVAHGTVRRLQTLLYQRERDLRKQQMRVDNLEAQLRASNAQKATDDQPLDGYAT